YSSLAILLGAENFRESGNSYVDNFFKNVLNEINNYSLSWIPFDELKFISKIGEGGFATVYRGEWRWKSRNIVSPVAIKLFKGSQNNCEEAMKE
ncbi:3211_t:CDS:1, partial [Racocetra fulgida]